MTIGLPAWTRREAFSYVESLAGPLLAWEFLRRNPAYRNAWLVHDPVDTETARRDWGLLLFIDPALDARAANPIWCPDPPTTLRLIPATGARDGIKLYDLDVDRSAPDAVRDEAGTYLTAMVGLNAWKVHIADGLSPQDPFAIAINADAHAQQRAAAAERFIRDLGHRSAVPRGTTLLRIGRVDFTPPYSRHSTAPPRARPTGKSRWRSTATSGSAGGGRQTASCAPPFAIS